MNRHKQFLVWAIGILLLIVAPGCRKRVPIASVLPPQAQVVVPAPAAAPTISEFTVEPSAIERGQSALLKWATNDATEVRISEGIGVVPAAGQRRVSPADPVVYTLTATGPGGSATAVAALGVALPIPPPPPVPTTPTLTLSDRLAKEVNDAYFDFDESNIRPDALEVLTRDAAALKLILNDFPNHTVVIEGHCDERGSAEYNLALGDRRTRSAKDFLVQMGIANERLIAISYGKERPQCAESNETCWQKNRRVHFIAGEEQKLKVVGQIPESTQQNQ